MGLRSTAGGGGEIVQVQGGHIIRATGRKDRHSKVFTAKGPRDRRVRLSAHTAIQFYDVQDRLGYDRPSKAVDWLIKKAKASIDKLAELPHWDPTAAAGVSNAADHHGNVRSTDIPVGDQTGSSSAAYHPQLHSSSAAAFAVDSQSLSDSMKLFFPITTSSGENPAMNFQNYPHELISRGSNQNEDLCLSLHTTLQDPGGGGSAHHHHLSSNDQTVFPGSGSLAFDGGWTDPQNHQDLRRFTRLMGWGVGGGEAAVRGGQGIMFNPSQLPPPPQSTAYNFQRGTLQSSFSPLLVQHHHHHHHHNHSSISDIGHGSEGFMGFSIPSHIHGDQLHGGASMSNTASSSSLSPDSSQY